MILYLDVVSFFKKSYSSFSSLKTLSLFLDSHILSSYLLGGSEINKKPDKATPKVINPIKKQRNFQPLFYPKKSIRLKIGSGNYIAIQNTLNPFNDLLGSEKVSPIKLKAKG